MNVFLRNEAAPQVENSWFCKIVTLLKLLLCEMKKNSLSIDDYSKILVKVMFTLLENISA